MIFKLIKLLLSNAKKHFSSVLIFEKIIEYLIYCYFINVILNNIYLSLILLFLIIFLKYIYKNVYIIKLLITSHDFEQLLLKPINPIFQTLIYGIDLVDLIINIIIVLVISVIFSNYIPLLLSVLIVLFALHLLFLSIMLLVSNKFSIEKAMPLLVIICLIPVLTSKSLMGLTSLLGVSSTFLFAVALLFLSFKLWNFALKKYS